MKSDVQRELLRVIVCVIQMIQGYADFMYQVGLLDERQREVFRNATNQGLQFIKEKKWIEADEARHVLQLHRSIKQIKSD